MRGELKSDSVLVDEALADLQIEDPIDKIIAENYGKSSQMISDVIYETLGKRITKQAIEKRREKHIIPMVRDKRLLEITRDMSEAERTRGYEPPIGKTPEEIEEEEIREKFESRPENLLNRVGKKEEEE
jgi:hypothetical protein